MIEYTVGDERPYWSPTVEVDGVTDDMTSGYTFRVTLATTAGAAPVLTKTTGITGGPAGSVSVAWAVGDLELPAGLYAAQLRGTRTVDSKDWTINEQVRLKPRNT